MLHVNDSVEGIATGIDLTVVIVACVCCRM